MVWPAVYLIDSYTVVHSGRPMPAADDVAQCGEGVNIDPVLSEAWKNGDNVWNPVSSCIVTLRLLLSEKEVPGLGSKPFYISLISVYAPTCPDVKNGFYNDLQASLNSVPKDDLLILVGDFNARVGSTPREEDSVWHGVRGYHGVREMNERSENLLSFCAMNELFVMNTLFEKAK